MSQNIDERSLNFQVPCAGVLTAGAGAAAVPGAAGRLDLSLGLDIGAGAAHQGLSCCPGWAAGNGMCCSCNPGHLLVWLCLPLYRTPRQTTQLNRTFVVASDAYLCNGGLCLYSGRTGTVYCIVSLSLQSKDSECRICGSDAQSQAGSEISCQVYSCHALRHPQPLRVWAGHMACNSIAEPTSTVRPLLCRSARAGSLPGLA